MRIAYLDCFSGISGDMALGALIDAGASAERIQSAIESMGLTQIRFRTERVRKKGFRALRVVVEAPEEHSHRHLHDIEELIQSGTFSDAAKKMAIAIFRRLAKAEAKVHGTSVSSVHFHEVGAADSIADIVGFAVALDELKIKRIEASPVPVGTGIIQIAHGAVSLPAPATALLLKNVPIVASEIQAELTTPTGAAILSELVSNFGSMPSMTLKRIGCGAGSRDLKEQSNVLRIFIGKVAKTASKDTVIQLETNLDDISGEQIGFTIERLLQAGALDVFTIPVQMKKNRPGVILGVIARPTDQQTLETILFEETNTLGVRSIPMQRTILPRAEIVIATEWGDIRAKLAKLPSGRVVCSPEYSDCREIALKFQVSYDQVVANALRSYLESDSNQRKKPS